MTGKKVSKEKEEVIELNFGKYLGNARKNPWMVATIVLAIFLIVVLATGGSSGEKSVSVSPEEAAENVIAFINSNPNAQGEATLVSAQQNGQFYEVILSYQGQQVPVFVTLDGEFLFTEPVPIGSGVN